jgi:hypothetical protein
MAKKEEIQKKNIDASNKSLADQLDLVSQINDKMQFLVKNAAEKFTQDKLATDLTKQAVSLTKSLSSEYSSLKDVEKDIAKNKKLQNEIARVQLNLEKEIGDKGKKRIEFIKNQEKGLSRSKDLLDELRKQELAGVKGAKEQADTLSKQIYSRQKSLSTQIQNLGVEEREYMLLQETQTVLEDNLLILEEQSKIQENLSKGMGTFGRAAEGAQKALEAIGAGELGKKLGLDAAAKKAKEMAYELTEGGKKSLGFFGKMRVAVGSFGAALKSALGPIALIGMIVDAYKKGEEAAIRLNDENVDLARTLGVSQSTANKLAGDIKGIGASMGITGGAAMQAAGGIYNALDGAEKLSKKTLETFMKLNVFAGMSAESIAGIQRLSKLTGDEAGKVADEMARTAQSTIKAQKVNVSMKQVMEGVGKISNILKLNMGGSAEGLTKAFIQSKKLGLELSKVEDIANGLLNIEDSIAAEMEAELLTGKELNLEKAREAALNNDTATLMTEIANQFGSIEDYQKMNRVQQEAFAKSIGMSRDGLADMLVSSKENAAANTDMVSEQDKGVAAMQSAVKLSESLAAKEEARANQFAKIFELLHPIVEAFKDLGPLVLELITPIVETLAPILQDFMEKMLPEIKEQFKIIGTVIGAIMEALVPVFTTLMDIGKMILPIISNIFRTFAPIIIDIVKALQPVILLLADAAKQLLPIIADVFNQIIPIVAELLKMLVPIVQDLLSAMLPIIKPVLDIFIELVKVALPAFIGFLNLIMPILKPILTAFQGLAEIISGILNGDWNKVGNGLKKIAEGLINTLLGYIQYVINLPLLAINTLLDLLPGVGANTIPMIKLPKVALAEGGIVSKPTNALIGEAGPEAVVPLNSNKSMNVNTAALEAKIEKLIAIVEKGGNVFIDGNKVGTTLALSNYRQQ